MSDNPTNSIPKVKLVRSQFEKILIHDRRSFKTKKEEDVLLALKKSHESRPQNEHKDPIKITIKIRPEWRKKEIRLTDDLIKNQTQVENAKKIIAKLDDEVLALVFMNADPLRVVNGLRKLAESRRNEKLKL